MTAGQKWLNTIAGAVASALFVLAYDVASSLTSLNTQVAVMNVKLESLAVTLAGVPDIQRRLFIVEGRIEDHEGRIVRNRDDIKELKGDRGK